MAETGWPVVETDSDGSQLVVTMGSGRGKVSVSRSARSDPAAKAGNARPYPDADADDDEDDATAAAVSATTTATAASATTATAAQRLHTSPTGGKGKNPPAGSNDHADPLRLRVRRPPGARYWPRTLLSALNGRRLPLTVFPLVPGTAPTKPLTRTARVARGAPTSRDMLTRRRKAMNGGVRCVFCFFFVLFLAPSRVGCTTSYPVVLFIFLDDPLLFQ